MNILLKKEKNFNSICHSCVSENLVGNKVLHTAGSSGSADAAPRMTEKYGRSTPSLSLRGGFANEAISCRLPRPIGLAMTGYKKCGLAMTGECGRSTPTCHPWTSVSEIRGSTGRTFNVPQYTRFVQYGRSMVEMLGVLAVMGVLSVVGIAGYHSAMNRHHANTIIEEAKMHSVLLSGQALLKGLPETTNLENLRYPFTYHKESEWGYSLNLAGLEKGVCQILQGQRNLGWAETVLINNGADCKDENQVAFYINTGMTTEITNEDRVVACANDEDCGECGRCGEQQVCVFDDFYCTDPDKPYCNRGRCQECEKGKVLSLNGNCNDCKTSGSIVTSEENCTRMCLERIYVSRANQGNCVLPCPNGQFANEIGRCFSCDYTGYAYTNSQNCVSSCPNRVYNGQICTLGLGQCPEGYVMQDSYDRTCLKCDSPSSIEPQRIYNGDCISLCGDLREIRTFTGTNNITHTACALKTCPDDTPIRGYQGQCIGCGINTTYVLSEDECYKCPNSISNIDGAGRPICRVCPPSPSHVYIQGERQCNHCGFKWENEKCIRK